MAAPLTAPPDGGKASGSRPKSCCGFNTLLSHRRLSGAAFREEPRRGSLFAWSKAACLSAGCSSHPPAPSTRMLASNTGSVQRGQAFAGAGREKGGEKKKKLSFF